MTHKIIDTREKRIMTEEQGEAIMRAFERFQPEGSTHLRLPPKEHLDREFRPGVCCEHEWIQMTLDPEGTRNLQRVFGETELGDRQTICARCRALALWEKGELFAYDAIALRPEKPERENPKSKNQRRPERRERR